MSNALPHLVADRYRLVQPLGQGGMGRVWKARDEVLHRDVAIKELVPPPGLTEDERREMRERSLREARAIARLNHINVVRVFDVLRTDGDPWIVMEYIPSRSLQETLASGGPVSPVRAAEIGLGVLGALRAAHRAGVMHRDVKPGNVLLGDDGRVVLTDFGLATMPGDPNVTRTGLVLGSPAYIAPERARDGTAGPEADLWSLGATLYAAVEGQSPYARPSAMGTIAALATEPPPPAKNAGPLKAVLNGLLRKDPTQRMNAEVTERLLRRVAHKRPRGAMSLLDGVRRPSPHGPREARTSVVPLPLPRPAEDQSAEAPAAAALPPVDVAPAAAPTVDAAAPTGPVPLPVPRDAAAPTGPVPPLPVPGDAAAPTGPVLPFPVPGDAAAPTAQVAPLPSAEPPTAVVPAPAKPADVEAGPTPRQRAGGGVAPSPAADPGRPGTAAGPSLAPGGPTAPSRGGKRRTWLIVATVAALVLALAVILPLADREPAGNSGAQPPAGATTQPVAPQTSSPATPPPTTAAATPPAASATGRPEPVVPSGWHLYTDETGFRLPVPDGWRITREKYGSAPDEVRVTFSDPRGGRWLLIDQTNRPRPDPVADWREQEANRKDGYRNYRRITLQAVSYWDKAADWEWTYTEGGTEVRTRNRGFVTARDKAYGIRWQTPAAAWNDNLDDFQVIADGFRPVRE